MRRLASFPLLIAAFLFGCLPPTGASACDAPASVCFHAGDGSFALIKSNSPAAVVSDAGADPAVRRVAASFAADLERVSGQAARRVDNPLQASGPIVVIGELGNSPIIDGLVAAGKLDVTGLAGQWEGFRMAVLDDPRPNVPRALIIVGSDRRGAVFGAYDLSEKIGVSPWYWFADVPVEQRSDVFITAGTRDDAPKVRYRGFFINDENPSFSTWAYKHFGGINSKMYEHIFELLLRLKGNYLWPAMWRPKAFAVDDPNNIVLADAMGVVMGTSHHEPMTRAHAEWTLDPADSTTGGPWDYTKNAENLRAFWRGGIERMMSKGDGKGYENVVTIGMRGDGDEAMTEGTAIPLLERIVADQRKIIADVTGRPASETPQVWALYKEVQDYYDKGMQVPDDVTLLFADDNWGQIRRLPTKNIDRPGGFGVYYHFDYVGGPRNYKWLNTVQIQKVWQQMDLAYRRHARNIWIVNVGDIKPMEYPLDFFLKMAWDPEAMTPEALEAYPEKWAQEQFGDELAPEIAEQMTTYSRYASRRKPELINADTWPLGEPAPPLATPSQGTASPPAMSGKTPTSTPSVSGQGTEEVLPRGEFGRYVEKWRELVESVDRTKKKLRPDQHAAYFQLIAFPVLALSNLYEMYYAQAWNHKLAALDDPRANRFADEVAADFRRDSLLTAEYHSIEGGKWDGMMSDVHMNYVIWQTPDEQTMPEVVRVDTSATAEVPPPNSVRGRDDKRSAGNDNASEEVPPPNSVRGRDDKGSAGDDDASEEVPPPNSVRGRDDKRSAGNDNASATGLSSRARTQFGREIPHPDESGFGMTSGLVIPASSFTRSFPAKGLEWKPIPHLGHSDAALVALPQGRPATTVEDGVRVEYDIAVDSTGPLKVTVHLTPTLDTKDSDGLRFGVSLDDGSVQTLVSDLDPTNGQRDTPAQAAWVEAVINNGTDVTTTFDGVAAGKHTLKLWRLDDNVVVERVVVGR